MQCLLCDCVFALEIHVLQLVLPLPIANLYALIHFCNSRIGLVCDECPGCKNLVVVESNDLHKQISCSKCMLHWCHTCQQPPHWPLNCAQNAKWNEKFEHQYKLDCARIESDEGYVADKGGNTIAQQFSTICSEARARRLDARLSVQLAKNMRRMTNHREEQRLIALRKTALHILEYGFAWLYMTRGSLAGAARPKEWPVLKVLLAGLRKQTECIEGEILFAGSLTDAGEVAKKLERIQLLIDQVVGKFRAIH